MSAIDQYCEAIPSPVGDRGNGDADRGGVAIPPAAKRALEHRGEDGKAIVSLSGASSKQGKTQASTPHGSVPPSVKPAPESQSPFAALAAGFDDAGNTAGPLFGTALLLLALVFFATAWLRYRRRAQN